MAVPDVLHFHGQAEGALLSRRLGIPAVLSYDYFRFRTDHLLLPTGRSMLYWPYRHMLRKFDRLLPCSGYCARESCEHWQISTAKVRILYNGVNLAQFRPDTQQADLMRQSLGLDRRVVLYVGRVCTQKGSDVLMESVRILRKTRTDFTLVVAGPIGQFGVSCDTSQWSASIDAVGGRYIGPVEEDRLAAVYNMADVFVMPTREFEMFGMAAVEAQACGKPVVASDHGGLPETVPEEVGGRFPVGDAPALARRLDALLSDQALYQRCARAALANARRFDWSAICDDLQGYYPAA
jgi:glycosyltransferase involved in cell wall biosynthesis